MADSKYQELFLYDSTQGEIGIQPWAALEQSMIEDNASEWLKRRTRWTLSHAHSYILRGRAVHIPKDVPLPFLFRPSGSESEELEPYVGNFPPAPDSDVVVAMDILYDLTAAGGFRSGEFADNVGPRTHDSIVNFLNRGVRRATAQVAPASNT